MSYAEYMLIYIITETFIQKIIHPFCIYKTPSSKSLGLHYNHQIPKDFSATFSSGDKGLSAFHMETRLSGHHFDGLMQERRNSIANALELHLSCINP